MDLKRQLFYCPKCQSILKLYNPVEIPNSEENDVVIYNNTFSKYQQSLTIQQKENAKQEANNFKFIEISDKELKHIQKQKLKQNIKKNIYSKQKQPQKTVQTWPEIQKQFNDLEFFKEYVEQTKEKDQEKSDKQNDQEKLAKQQDQQKLAKLIEQVEQGKQIDLQESLEQSEEIQQTQEQDYEDREEDPQNYENLLKQLIQQEKQKGNTKDEQIEQVSEQRDQNVENGKKNDEKQQPKFQTIQLYTQKVKDPQNIDEPVRANLNKNQFVNQQIQEISDSSSPIQQFKANIVKNREFERNRTQLARLDSHNQDKIVQYNLSQKKIIRTFRTKKHWKKSMQEALKVEDKSFYCGIHGCNKTFKHRGGLQNHQRQKHNITLEKTVDSRLDQEIIDDDDEYY